MNDYISKLRAKIGTEKFIHPGARILIENEKGEMLFIQRRDSGKLGLPAGALEENESIEECIIREVLEETGLTISNPIVIGISSNPGNETVIYPNGDQIQYFTIEFYCKEWSGEINIEDKEEISQARFLGQEYLRELPSNEKSIIASLAYYKKCKKVSVR